MRSALKAEDWEIKVTCGTCRIPLVIEKDDIKCGRVPEGPHDMPEEHFYYMHCGKKWILSNVPGHLQAYAEKNRGKSDLDIGDY